MNRFNSYDIARRDSKNYNKVTLDLAYYTIGMAIVLSMLLLIHTQFSTTQKQGHQNNATVTH